ncbi:7TM-DISM domain-containing protein [Agarivorans litoreus]|uniref:7TM-DISM domain-containing protein n=1 Tax=Agarivorans litoreus TaxID=1510455 RepID=UPI0035A23E28
MLAAIKARLSRTKFQHQRSTDPNYLLCCLGKTQLALALVLFSVCTLSVAQAESLSALHVNGLEDGVGLGEHFQVWHDLEGKADLADAIAAYRLDKFSRLPSKGSTGLQPGAFWSVFYLHNDSDKPITLNLEYVDHQLIYLNAYQRNTNDPSFLEIADLALIILFQSA